MSQHLDDIELRSEEVQEVLTRVPSWLVRQGSLLFLVIILLLLIVSYLIKYPNVIESEAVITTILPPEKIYSKSTGKIEKIWINNGALVSRDTPIALIENSANYQDVFYLKSIVDTLSINTSYFKFPIEKLPPLYLGEINTYFI